ncbi:spermidine/putrescine ABC transporter ATP-binding protein [Bacillus cereus]|nr:MULTISPECIES: spermidine/putrescine ABC transporter ATP-binding protein [Bacillus cereus group]PGV63575.1 spermidine/putrescine ABC transporter ATP-binding protein [Bacillus cereus]
MYYAQDYPALTGSRNPPQNSANVKKLGGSRAARKGPIGEG